MTNFKPWNVGRYYVTHHSPVMWDVIDREAMYADQVVVSSHTSRAKARAAAHMLNQDVDIRKDPPKLPSFCDTEAFVRKVLTETFKQKADAETVRAVAKKVSQAVIDRNG